MHEGSVETAIKVVAAQDATALPAQKGEPMKLKLQVNGKAVDEVDLDLGDFREREVRLRSIPFTPTKVLAALQAA